MKTLDRYITRQAITTTAVVVVALVSMLSLFALFEEMDESAVTYGFTDAAMYVLKTLPRRIDEVIVYALLLGYLITLGRLAETNELTICRVSGMSPARLMLALLPSIHMDGPAIAANYPNVDQSIPAEELRTARALRASLSNRQLFERSNV